MWHGLVLIVSMYTVDSSFFLDLRRQLSQSGSAFSRDQSPRAAVSIFAVSDSMMLSVGSSRNQGLHSLGIKARRLPSAFLL